MVESTLAVEFSINYNTAISPVIQYWLVGYRRTVSIIYLDHIKRVSGSALSIN